MKYSAKGVPPQSFVDWMALASPDWTPTYRDLRRPQSEDDLPPQKWTGLSRSAFGLDRADIAQG